MLPRLNEKPWSNLNFLHGSTVWYLFWWFEIYAKYIYADTYLRKHRANRYNLSHSESEDDKSFYVVIFKCLVIRGNHVNADGTTRDP